jgi:hypothetical protein
LSARAHGGLQHNPFVRSAVEKMSRREGLAKFGRNYGLNKFYGCNT